MYVYVFAMHNSLFAIHTKPPNQDFKSPITDVRISGLPKIIVSGPKQVHMARHGLILGQDGALPFPIISIYRPGQNIEIKQSKKSNFGYHELISNSSCKAPSSVILENW